MPRRSLTNSTVKELHQYCRDSGIRGYSNMRKADLIDYIGSSKSSSSSYYNEPSLKSSSSSYYNEPSSKSSYSSYSDNYGRSLEDRTVKELHQYCRDSGIGGYSNLKKADLIDHIASSEGSDTSYCNLPSLKISSSSNYNVPSSKISSSYCDNDGTALEDKTVKELHEYCRQKNIERYSGLRKADLIDHIIKEVNTSKDSKSYGLESSKKSTSCGTFGNTVAPKLSFHGLYGNSSSVPHSSISNTGTRGSSTNAGIYRLAPTGANETEKIKDKNNGGVHASTQIEVELGLDDEIKLPTAVNTKKLLHSYEELFLNEEDSDLSIQVQDQTFRAHKIILKARSSVFAAMLRHTMKEKTTGVVEIEDCSPESFHDFLHYIYCGSVDKISEGNVFDLYTAADKYDVQDLKSECVAFMKKHLSVENICDIMKLSLQHCETELMKLATDFFTKNMSKIIATDKWQTFIVDNPIQSDELLIKALS